MRHSGTITKVLYCGYNGVLRWDYYESVIVGLLQKCCSGIITGVLTVGLLRKCYSGIITKALEWA
jgi:hypothetical protein